MKESDLKKAEARYLFLAKAKFLFWAIAAVMAGITTAILMVEQGESEDDPSVVVVECIGTQVSSDECYIAMCSHGIISPVICNGAYEEPLPASFDLDLYVPIVCWDHNNNEICDPEEDAWADGVCNDCDCGLCPSVSFDDCYDRDGDGFCVAGPCCGSANPTLERWQLEEGDCDDSAPQSVGYDIPAELFFNE